MAVRVHIGTSGWDYRHWRGRFYPDGAEPIRFAAEAFDALEINTTFYRSVLPGRFAKWRELVADLASFHFAIKGSRYITHQKKLREISVPLANFFATGPLLLGAALGPILWQLPPNLTFRADVLQAFFECLPRNVADAQRLARHHDQRFAGRSSSARGPGLFGDGRLRYAVEPRHVSFDDDRFFELCRRYGVAAVIADTAGKFIALNQVTTDFSYLRLHGSRQLYQSQYNHREILTWANRIRSLPCSEAWVFFDNDAEGHAPYDALRLRAELDMPRSGRMSGDSYDCDSTSRGQ